MSAPLVGRKQLAQSRAVLVGQYRHLPRAGRSGRRAAPGAAASARPGRWCSVPAGGPARGDAIIASAERVVGRLATGLNRPWTIVSTMCPWSSTM